MKALDLEDFLLIAEAILEIPAETLKHARSSASPSRPYTPRSPPSTEDFYPEPADRAAILCSRIVRNHALPDGNKRVALIAMLEFIERNGMIWATTAQDEIAQTIEWLAEGSMSESEFIIWVRARVHCP